MADGLVLDRVRLTRGDRLLVALDLAIRPGEVVTLMGPSGSGKSTLLSFLTGALPAGFAASGRVRLDGTDITDLPAHRRRLGILFQDDLLFPHLSVGANLAFGLAPGGSRASRRAAVEAALAEVGLDGLADRDPATLSGGQKARVALMRMLLADPRALLLDEAFSGLDRDLRAQTRAMVFARAKARALPVLMVTHEAADADAAGGPVIRLDPPG
jgi:putative thiamine transport system ATP-binding protein